MRFTLERFEPDPANVQMERSGILDGDCESTIGPGQCYVFSGSYTDGCAGNRCSCPVAHNGAMDSNRGETGLGKTTESDDDEKDPGCETAPGVSGNHMEDIHILPSKVGGNVRAGLLALGGLVSHVLPVKRGSQWSADHLPITVAGQLRRCTGFPFHPVVFGTPGLFRNKYNIALTEMQPHSVIILNSASISRVRVGGPDTGQLLRKAAVSSLA